MRITLREFSRGFSKIKGNICEVSDNGVIIGTWIPLKNGLPMPVGHRIEQNEVESAEDGLCNDVGHACEKCEKESDNMYMIWEGGEERKICLDCIKKVMSGNILKGFLRRNKKL